MGRMSRKSITVWVVGGLLSFAFSACGSEPNEDEETCVVCPAFAGGAVTCFDTWGSQTICSFDQEAAATSCIELGGFWVPATVCPAESGETGSGNDEPWSPTRNVDFDPESGEYVIDQLAFEELKLDPAPLFGDTSHLRLLESGYYSVATVGELADALGWEEGDLLLDVNGHSLDGPAAFAAAYTAIVEETAFRLTVRRGQSKTTLRYLVE